MTQVKKKAYIIKIMVKLLELNYLLEEMEKMHQQIIF